MLDCETWVGFLWSWGLHPLCVCDRTLYTSNRKIPYQPSPWSHIDKQHDHWWHVCNRCYIYIFILKPFVIISKVLITRISGSMYLLCCLPETVYQFILMYLFPLITCQHITKFVQHCYIIKDLYGLNLVHGFHQHGLNWMFLVIGSQLWRLWW